MAEQQNSSSTSTPTTPVTDNPKGGIESLQYTQEKSSHWQLVIDQTHVTPAVINWPYNGSGTEEDPYVVVYIENDRRNPLLFPRWKKWMITLLVAFVSSTFPLTASSQEEQKKHGWPFCPDKLCKYHKSFANIQDHKRPHWLYHLYHQPTPVASTRSSRPLKLVMKSQH